uniref:Na+/H+ antiporter n=1 Tax=Eubacterium cellulosolvens (strain ATCC 43171 / JCM 9499 / 6) TaxID=633697 RepID=I5ATM5_EUBC6
MRDKDSLDEGCEKPVVPEKMTVLEVFTEDDRKRQETTPAPNAKALLPIGVFLVLYLGFGIYYTYVSPVAEHMGFYVMSVVVAFGFALMVAFLQNRSLKFEDKIHICALGIGDDNITVMLLIFLMAGAFSGIAKAAGGVESTSHLLLNIIPGRFSVPGLFVIACLISMSMGTSVGTITVLVPIAAAVANTAGFDLALCVGTVVGGAMFGDNLSFISDTTIAATKTQGVEMKDKFRTNLKIALPAAAITLVILIVFALQGGEAVLGHYDYSYWLALPYFIVLVMALFGINVFLVLGAGMALFLASGMIVGSLSFANAFAAMGEGTTGMFETMIVTILVSAISALIEVYGGFESILAFIRRHFHGRRGGMFGIGFLTAMMDIATANNTVAIVVAAPIAKTISAEYDIEPRKTASLLDTCSCVFQGIIPYGAQLLIAANLAGIGSVSIMKCLYYPYLLLVFVVLSILPEGKRQNKPYGK